MRRIVKSPGFIEIEMRPISLEERLTDKQTPRKIDSLICERPSLPGTTLPDMEQDTFKNAALSFIHQGEAEFSKKDAAFSAANVIPTILTELSHNIPGLGVFIGAANSVSDTSDYKKIRHNINEIHRMIHENNCLSMENRNVDFKKFLEDNPGVHHNAVMVNTLAFILEQLKRKLNKAEQVLAGKVLQITGSALTLSGLLTHGVTAIPGIILGIGGTILKVRIKVRSFSNFVKKKYEKKLSSNREMHARYLYGLILKHLVRKDVYLGNFSESREARQALQLVENISTATGSYQDTEKQEELAVQVAHLFLDLNKTEQVIEYGFWSIMAGIKT